MLYRFRGFLESAKAWQSAIVAVPYFWLLIFFLIPFFLVLKISLAEYIVASPPFSKLIQFGEEGQMYITLIFDNFVYLWEDNLYYKTYLNSLRISIISTILCLLIGYPIAPNTPLSLIHISEPTRPY